MSDLVQRNQILKRMNDLAGVIRHFSKKATLYTKYFIIVF